MSRGSTRLEKIFKGVANHRRIDIIFLLKRKPDLPLYIISQELNGNFKTVAEHTRRLVAAGLVDKTRDNNLVLHSLSPYGEKIYEILKSF